MFHMSSKMKKMMLCAAAAALSAVCLGEVAPAPAPAAIPAKQAVAKAVDPGKVAAEVNGNIVPRAMHEECIVKADDRIEIVGLIGGG
jgi:thiamine biosynthesis protein ThiS